ADVTERPRDCLFLRVFHLVSAPALLLVAGYRPHRDLHSFPTRRSSDLERLRLAGSRRNAGCTHDLPGSLVFQNKQVALFAVADRSEEHTSELQSRENLVCRLLLEKQKNRGGADATRYRQESDPCVKGRR